MATDYNSIIPNKILFNLKEIEEIGLIKTDMAKKLVYNGYLIVAGEDIFAKKDSIKACGFRWDSKSKSWYKQIEQGAA